MKRSRKVVIITATLVAVPLVALVVLWPRHPDVPEVRLNRLYRIEGEHPATFWHEFTPDFSSMPASTGETWMAEFLIQVPAESRIGLGIEPIAVELLGATGTWTRPITNEEPQALQGQAAWLALGKTASAQVWRVTIRTRWVALHSGVKSCRFTIRYRPETLQERGARLLQTSGTSRRFPALSGWITKQLSTAQRWRICRREVPVMASSMKLETYNRTAVPGYHAEENHR